MAIRTGGLKRRTIPEEAGWGQVLRTVSLAAAAATVLGVFAWASVSAAWSSESGAPVRTFTAAVWSDLSGWASELVGQDTATSGAEQFVTAQLATGEGSAAAGSTLDAGSATGPWAPAGAVALTPSGDAGTVLAGTTSSVRSVAGANSSSAPTHSNAGGNGNRNSSDPQPAVIAEPSAEEPTATPTATPEPSVSSQPAPTATIAPTPVPVAQPTPAPTSEPSPISTPTPTPTAQPAPQPTASPLAAELRVSATSTRSGSQSLAGSTLSGLVYVFLAADTDVSSVRFYLDQPPSGGARHTEYFEPYDFSGGSTSTANAWDTGTASEGAHTINAVVVTPTGEHVVSAGFSVDHEDAPTPTPTATPTPTPSPSPGGSLTPSGPIVLDGESNVVIDGLHITSTSGDCIVVANSSNVTIRNSEIGPCGGRGIWLKNSSSVTIVDNYIHPEFPVSGCCDVGDGILAQRGSSILIQGNVIAYGETNIELMSVSGTTVRGNFLLNPMGPFPRGQQVQVGNYGSYGPSTGIVIDRNYTIASRSSAYKYPAVQEDAINIGSASNVSITANYVVGGHSGSGCGIIADHSATQVTIDGNHLNETANCGIGITTGHQMRVTNNRILNTVAIGGSSAIYVWDIYNLNACNDVVVSGNISYSANTGYVVDLGGCTNVTIQNHTSGDAALNQLSPFGTKFPPPAVPPVPYSTRPDSPWS